ncbi:hypothetical protein BJ878DRAFT_490796 [Calycina marina]|uniref:Secreted protein n=1 Tax=Calycina marina TaxID=1763456 RepID=A0A9P7ZAE9_9HELO|nr:hypothetical protein BJ878DRAFT_490796 [Calycina marina]
MNLLVIRLLLRLQLWSILLMPLQQLTALHHLLHPLCSARVALLLRMSNALGHHESLNICLTGVWRQGIFQRLASKNGGTTTALPRIFSLAVLLNRRCIYRGITISK